MCYCCRSAWPDRQPGPGNPGRGLLRHVQDWSIINRSADQLCALFAKSKFGDAPVDVRIGGSGLQSFARCTQAG